MKQKHNLNYDIIECAPVLVYELYRLMDEEIKMVREAIVHLSKT